ncbi:MAG: PAS domain-containing sensor histidine kinase [Chromatiales bacterium]|nr:PAS domain-containing sensor histidine kinase [Chromatiales bacterium]
MATLQNDHLDPVSLKTNWQPLLYFNLYRIGLLVILILLSSTNNLPIPLGSSNPELFVRTLFLYLFAALFITFTLAIQRPTFRIQLHFQLILDIIFITLLMHSSGGVSSGVAMLLIISVANHSALASGQMPSLFAALATIALLLEQTYNLLYENGIEFNYPFAGLLGIVLFATALLTNALAQRARVSEELAKQRGIDLANMAELTEYAISQMKTGIIAVDPGRQIRMINDAAQNLLGSSKNMIGRDLVQLSAELSTALERWLRDGNQNISPFIAANNAPLQSHFTIIGGHKIEGVLIFVDDADAAIKQAQQVKLAALGRLTAGIAHEIRNPLGAISHASELLSESESIVKNDLRLTEIIYDNCHRLNSIVETILQLGKREQQVNSESFNLLSWLNKFVESLCESQQILNNEIELSITPKDLIITFDSGHLHQILWNICQNGIRYAHPEKLPILKIIAFQDETSTYIDVIDTGDGVDDTLLSQIFEPFVTTESKGTGLGLYISKTLANSNHADLAYHPTKNGDSCFRIKINN